MSRRTRLTTFVVWTCLAAAMSVVAAPGASAGVANAGLPGAPRANPLAGMRWGYYTGLYDGVYSTYLASRGATRQRLGKIALRPTMHWFGAWVPNSDAQASPQRYIAQVTGGDPTVLTQIAVFRLDPWEQAACSTAPGRARQASYRVWVDRFARGIGSSRTAIVLQPDLPFALCSPGRAAWLRMVNYATRRFSGLAHTTVYVDVGAAQWASVNSAVALLEAAGIRHARGFALNTTEYDSTSRELSFGGAIVRALGARGIGGKHFVINTAENGAPFLNGQYPGDPSNPRVCRSRTDRLCATLGIPPTTDVANPAWHLGAHARSLAARFADAYLWVGRPWLDHGAGNLDVPRALRLVASSPFS